ncbi:hypothetical protein ACMDCR_03080 [Labrys okinawensis]|uniref:hypothetical protein n=1 Tax=Labrys okinawensis TaxID=346911 RepID=UPI0039BD292F
MSAKRFIHLILTEAKEAIAPTLFFIAGFNLILLTTQLILADYYGQLFSFAGATFAALVVGKAVLVANAMPLLRRFDHAPLIRPILFKTLVYCTVVFMFRFLERIVEYFWSGGTIGALPAEIAERFSWHRFAAIQIWIFVLFLIYVGVAEINTLLGEGSLWRILFHERAISGSNGTKLESVRTNPARH